MNEMRMKSESLRKQIISEEQERQQIEQDLNTLTNRLKNIEEESIHMDREKQELERTLIDTENAKSKIMESFRALLNVL